ncbi:hypothetical protein BDF14DRAFT_1750593 [Spinellus fusiger]|nr:hypothetical protein BDF14DRAFT_1750593 [Spinellus fusiger]
MFSTTTFVIIIISVALHFILVLIPIIIIVIIIIKKKRIIIIVIIIGLFYCNVMPRKCYSWTAFCMSILSTSFNINKTLLSIIQSKIIVLQCLVTHASLSMSY